jgi:hypothetical protein
MQKRESYGGHYVSKVVKASPLITQIPFKDPGVCRLHPEKKLGSFSSFKIGPYQSSIHRDWKRIHRSIDADVSRKQQGSRDRL